MVVTGGGAGIGQAIAELAAKEGTSVVLAEINGAQGAATVRKIEAAGGHALCVVTDVSDAVAVDAMVAETLSRFGRIDALVNNAGIDVEEETTKYTPAMWNAFAVNVARRLAITVYCGIFHTKPKKQSKEESPPEFMKIHRNFEKNVKKTEIYEKNKNL